MNGQAQALAEPTGSTAFEHVLPSGFQGVRKAALCEVTGANEAVLKVMARARDAALPTEEIRKRDPVFAKIFAAIPDPPAALVGDKGLVRAVPWRGHRCAAPLPM